MNRLARHDFMPTKRSYPGAEWVRGRDGLIPWSSLKKKLLRIVPWWLNKFESDIGSDDVLLYVIFTCVEARWLVWWPKHGERCPPYAIRANLAHKGGDLDPSLMYKRVTLQNFHEHFGKDSRWYHCTNTPAALCVQKSAA